MLLELDTGRLIEEDVEQDEDDVDDNEELEDVWSDPLKERPWELFVWSFDLFALLGESWMV